MRGNVWSTVEHRDGERLVAVQHVRIPFRVDVVTPEQAALGLGAI